MQKTIIYDTAADNPMKILVTGGAGFIGSHVIEHSLRAGHEVAALDNLSSGRKENVPDGVKLYEVDIRDREATFAAFRDFKPDAVSHQAAQASVSVSVKDPALDSSINVVGGIHVAEAALDVGTTNIVFASTGGAIYGNVESGSATEESPELPYSPYAISKLAYEQLLGVFEREHGLKARVLRYANVFGPRQDPHGEAGVVAIFFQRVLANEPIQVNAMRSKGDDGCIRDYVYVGDVAKANILALEGNLDIPVLNLGTGVETTTRTLSQTVIDLVGNDVEVRDAEPRAGDIERSQLDGSKAVERLGPLVDLKTGLAETADYFRSAK